MKHTDKKLQTLQDKDKILLIENNIRGRNLKVIGDRFVIEKIRNILSVDANSLYGHSMTQTLPYDEFKFDRNVKLDNILKIDNDSDFGYLLRVDLKNPDNLKKNKTLSFLSWK